MTSQATSSPNTCACGCGTPIGPDSRWARGHFRRGEGTHRPIPGPGEPSELGGLGDDFPADLLGEDYGPPGPGWDGAELDGPGGTPEDFAPDPPPARLRPDTPGAGRGPAAPVKVTAALRRDIEAKISLPLEIGARAWQTRDPVCGGRAVEQRPAVAHALTNIVCQSPDLIDFFTGPAGGFMVYLELGAALWPVAEVVIAHILSHGHGQADEPGAAFVPDAARYAA